MATHLTELKRTLRREIPVTRRLGIRVVGVEDGALLLKAPLAANRNDKGTAFAGSLDALLLLTGWASVWLLLREAGISGTVVIRDSSLRYFRPVTSDFVARCNRPSPAQVTRFLSAVRTQGKGRLKLRVEINSGSKVAVAFTGRYVAKMLAR